jgi:DNA-binding MarR family transcriptional regulator
MAYRRSQPPPPAQQDGDGGWSVRVLGLMQFALERGMAETMAEVAPRHPQLRPAHLRVFRVGSLDAVRVTELATCSGMTKQSMHELIAHLQRHGYLRREPDPADARAMRIRLTTPGWELEQQMRAASARVHLSWLEQLGAERFDALWAALRQLTGRDDPVPDPAALRRIVDQAAPAPADAPPRPT